MISIAAAILFSPGALMAENWRTFTSAQGKTFQGRVVSKTAQKVTILRQSDNRTFEIPIEKLSTSDQSYLKAWKPPASVAGLPSESEDARLPKALYPRTRVEIRKARNEIEARPGPKWAPPHHIRALNDINIYRYLSGLGSEVKLNQEASKEVVVVLKEWDDLGEKPLTNEVAEKLRRFLRLRKGDIEFCVKAAVSAYGSDQEQTRVSRYRLLKPGMEEVGLGEFGTTAEPPKSGIFPHGSKSKGPGKFWTYPGFGFYPADKLHSNAWTCFVNKTLDPERVPEVRVVRLKDLPTKKPSAKTIQGEEIGVSAVHVYQNSVIFKPVDQETNQTISGPGIYAVLIKGGGVRVNYVVALF